MDVSLNNFWTSGFAMVPGAIPEDTVIKLREDVDRVAQEAGTTCVRHLRAKSESVDQLSRSELLAALLPAGYRPVRSIFFDKTIKENWPVAWHQDLTISVQRRRDIEGYGPWSLKDDAVHVQPPTALLERMVTLRIHLDDTPASNGALRVVPGSSTFGKIPAQEIADKVQGRDYTCDCAAGDVLMMSPLILHTSRRSANPGRRRIIHIEYAPRDALDSRLAWHEA